MTFAVLRFSLLVSKGLTREDLTYEEDNHVLGCSRGYVGDCIRSDCLSKEIEVQKETRSGGFLKTTE
ncbi:hypothetical protein PO124_24310 [Bacillus licheniformis]|nr:hypothetical protein [Bacillus licheniformis]